MLTSCGLDHEEKKGRSSSVRRLQWQWSCLLVSSPSVADHRPVLPLRQRSTRSCVSGHAASKRWTSRSYAVTLNPPSRSPYRPSPFLAIVEALPPHRRIRHLCSILIQLLTPLVSPSSSAPVAPTYATSLSSGAGRAPSPSSRPSRAPPRHLLRGQVIPFDPASNSSAF
jgi:hypothetical protein